MPNEKRNNTEGGRWFYPTMGAMLAVGAVAGLAFSSCDEKADHGSAVPGIEISVDRGAAEEVAYAAGSAAVFMA